MLIFSLLPLYSFWGWSERFCHKPKKILLFFNMKSFGPFRPSFALVTLKLCPRAWKHTIYTDRDTVTNVKHIFVFFKPSLLRIVQFCPFQAIYMLFLYLKVNIVKNLTFLLKISPDPTNQDFYFKIELWKMNTEMKKISIA